jgi:hypothetical protein
MGVDQISDLLIQKTADVNRRISVRIPPPTFTTVPKTRSWSARLRRLVVKNAVAHGRWGPGHDQWAMAGFIALETSVLPCVALKRSCLRPTSGG